MAEDSKPVELQLTFSCGWSGTYNYPILDDYPMFKLLVDDHPGEKISVNIPFTKQLFDSSASRWIHQHNVLTCESFEVLDYLGIPNLPFPEWNEDNYTWFKEYGLGYEFVKDFLDVRVNAYEYTPRFLVHSRLIVTPDEEHVKKYVSEAFLTDLNLVNVFISTGVNVLTRRPWDCLSALTIVKKLELQSDNDIKIILAWASTFHSPEVA